MPFTLAIVSVWNFRKKVKQNFLGGAFRKAKYKFSDNRKIGSEKQGQAEIPPPIPFLFVYLIGQPELFASGRQNQIKERKNSRPCPTQPDMRATKSETPLIFVAKN